MGAGSILLIGGARSGKSSLAVEMGRRHDGEVAMIATATALDGDMAERIARHRAERPAWPTVEEPHDLAGALDSSDGEALVIVDCLTMWVSNLMWRGEDEASILTAVESFTTSVERRSGRTVAITNEVGLGVHPETELGRIYRDTLGRVNAAVAGRFDRSLLMVAGRAIELRDPWEVLT